MDLDPAAGVRERQQDGDKRAAIDYPLPPRARFIVASALGRLELNWPSDWTRREDGRLVRRVLDAGRAAALRRAVVDYRGVERPLARWESEPTRELIEPDRPTT